MTWNNDMNAGERFSCAGEPVSKHVLLLLADGNRSVGYYDEAYGPGGRLHRRGKAAWVEPISGELIQDHYGEPVGWMILPEGLARAEESV